VGWEVCGGTTHFSPSTPQHRSKAKPKYEAQYALQIPFIPWPQKDHIQNL
jgi:hypothetical protein